MKIQINNVGASEECQIEADFQHSSKPFASILLGSKVDNNGIDSADLSQFILQIVGAVDWCMETTNKSQQFDETTIRFCLNSVHRHCQLATLSRAVLFLGEMFCALKASLSRKHSKTSVKITLDMTESAANEMNNESFAFVDSFFRSFKLEHPDIVEFMPANQIRLEKVEDEDGVASTFHQSEPKSAGTWLITGGTSGIGLELGKFLVEEFSVECLILVSFALTFSSELFKI